MQGDPTEGGLFVPAVKGGIDLAEQKSRFTRLDVLPFESEHQYMATLHKSKDSSKQLIYIKGSVESILARCGSQFDLMKGDVEFLGSGDQSFLSKANVLSFISWLVF